MVALAILTAGCASRLQEAVEFAEACERKYPGQCADYWANVENEEARRDQRRASAPRGRQKVGAAFRGLGAAYRDAGTPPAPAQPPVYTCRDNYIGGTTCTPGY